MKSIPATRATRTRDVPRSGWSMTRTQGGTMITMRPDDGPGRLGAFLAMGQVGREDDDHDDLGKLAELELEAADRDPASCVDGFTRAPADPQREDQEADVDQIGRPGEGTEPPVVEYRRQREDDGRDNGPHEAPHKRRIEGYRLVGRSNRVAVRHHQSEDGQEHRIRRDLEVVVAPRQPAGLWGPAPESEGLAAKKAHRSVDTVSLCSDCRRSWSRVVSMSGCNRACGY